MALCKTVDFVKILLIALLAAPLAGADQIVLTYTRDAWSPGTITNLTGAETEDLGWTAGTGGLSSKARIFRLKGMLAAMDLAPEGTRHPDTLYVDVNGNGMIDEGEAFPLKPGVPWTLEPANSISNPLTAEKVPLLKPFDGGENFSYMNVRFIDLNGQIFYDLSPWGSMRGTREVGGKHFAFVLRDDNKNGVFGEMKRTARSQSDTLTITADGKEETAPLQCKMILAGKTFSVDAISNGTALIIEPIETDFGLVTVPVENMEVELFNDAWGSFRIGHGRDRLLPVGTYHVASFTRTQAQPFARCSYEGPAGIEVVVEQGKKAPVAPKSLLIATVTKKSLSRQVIQLSLRMVTAEGAVFSGYSAATRASGLPFHITDSQGNVVIEDSFLFG